MNTFYMCFNFITIGLVNYNPIITTKQNNKFSPRVLAEKNVDFLIQNLKPHAKIRISGDSFYTPNFLSTLFYSNTPDVAIASLASKSIMRWLNLSAKDTDQTARAEKLKELRRK